MNNSHIGLKVGIFVAAGLALLAVLVLSFSRGVTFFESTYTLRIVLPTAAGLKPTADVMMSGVPIGKASGVELMPDGRSVQVTASILSKYKIRTNAVVHIDALGFLGDQYIEVTPSTNQNAAYWQNDAIVQAESPMNMQAAVKSVSGLLDQFKTTASGINLAISNLNQTILSGQSLSNLNVGLSTVETMVTSVRQTAQDAQDLIHSNAPAVDEAVTNLLAFSQQARLVAADLDLLVRTNRPGLDATVQNLRDTSASFKQVAADLQAGKGVVGGLLKDEEMKASTASLISNANAMAASFAAFGSNLDQKGIWRMLWKPKQPEKSEKSPPPAH
jgi:phospholipid/cholesterol/gamma-HCH transport system substrate-binding protein